MSVVQAGQINFTAVQAPGVIVQILPPKNLTFNGVPTNKIAIVGTASWGAVGVPLLAGSMNEWISNFGIPQVSEFDMGIHAYAATLQGANNLWGVRVTDGTDVNATVDILDTTAPTPAVGLTVDAKYTGTFGNKIGVKVTAGTKPGSYKFYVASPNGVPEIYDNITGTGNALWVNAAAAINNGQSNSRPPSQLVTATAGAATNPPALATYSLTGGTDGNSGVTASDLLGTDVYPRDGMYALRNIGTAMLLLANCSDTTTYAAQTSFAISEGMYVLLTGAVSQSLTQAAISFNASAIENYDAKFLIGDWIYINDVFNGGQQLISQQGFVAGLYAQLSPEQSGLNKPVQGIVGTESSVAHRIYTDADVIFMRENRLDVIAAPSPGGVYFALKTAVNSSSEFAPVNQDQYTRLTNYLAYSINNAVGDFIGQLQDPSVRLSAKNRIESFLQALAALGMIGATNGGAAYSVEIDDANNPIPLVQQGYMFANVRVANFGVIYNFVVNLENGDTTLVSTST